MTFFTASLNVVHNFSN